MPAKKTAAKQSGGFTAEERAAMRERAKELKAAGTREAGLKDLLAKVAEMPADERAIATRVHEIVTKVAPALAPKTWYGMPAWANDEGKIVVFFQNAGKFKARYSTLGFQDAARLDEGSMWPTSYALTKLTKADEERVAALVKQAAG